jgi:dachs protein
MLADPITSLYRQDEKAVDDCEIILDSYSRAVKEIQFEESNNNKDWAHGRKHIFLSEGARQRLEKMRETRRQMSAVKIQALWRGWHSRGGLESSKRAPPQPAVLQHLAFDHSTMDRVISQRPRPQPISGTPPPIGDNQMIHVDRCDFKTIQQTCSLFGLDLVSIFIIKFLNVLGEFDLLNFCLFNFFKGNNYFPNETPLTLETECYQC